MTDASTPKAWTALFLAWVVAVVASLGVLFIGEVLGQVPCNLCWFQRASMFPLAVILSVATYHGDFGVRVYALPLAVAGWLVAGFHTLLYMGIIPEAIEPCGVGPSCSSADMTILGTIPLPALSVLAFTVIIACLLPLRRRLPS
jgi:disulfide bond formation protein DsbB